MKKYKVKNRRKALFGEEVAASIAGATIGAAATLAAANINAKAAESAAKREAESTIAGAREQAQALRLQNENANALQTESQQFVREQNEENRNLQKQMQINLQMLAGRQDEKERLESTRLQVRNGGHASLRGRSKKLAGGIPYPGLQIVSGPNHVPAIVTDGGYLVDKMTTPTGELYEVKGNDHEHSHTYINPLTGKKEEATGVGMTFANNAELELEGDEDTKEGEKILLTPYDAKAITKHTLKGKAKNGKIVETFNPSDAIDKGMLPELAFAKQERFKRKYGISDDGSSPVEKTKYGKKQKALAGTDLNVNTLQQSLNLEPNMSNNTDAILAAANLDSIRKLKCGGRVKAKLGDFTLSYNNSKDPLGTIAKAPTIKAPNLPSATLPDTISTPSLNYNISYTPTDVAAAPVQPTAKADSGRTPNPYAGQIVGASITSLANIGGALWQTFANNKGLGYITNANRIKGNLLADAYANLRGVDANAIKRSDFAPAHAMAVIRAPHVNEQSQLALVDRSLQRQLSSINRNTASGAAQANRLSRAETDAYDQRAQIYNAANQLREKQIQANIAQLNDTANQNATRDVQSNNQYISSVLARDQYNADTQHQSILGIANSLADMYTGNASARANTLQANAASITNAINNSANSFANVVSGINKDINEKDSIFMGADRDTQVYGLLSANVNTYTKRRAENLYKSLKDSSNPQDIEMSNLLKRKFNLA